MNKRKQLQIPKEAPEPKRPAYSCNHLRSGSETMQSYTGNNGTDTDVNNDALEDVHNSAILKTARTPIPDQQQYTKDMESNTFPRQQKYDFINRLPTDVVGDILSRLSFKERHACMAICKAWNMYLSSWSGMWREIDICLEEGATDGWLEWIPKPETGHKIRHLRFFGNSVQMKKAFDVLTQRGQHRIESLVISSFYAWDTVDIPPAEQLSSFSSLLDLTGPSLIHLEFRNAYFPADMVMDKIFPVCKQLKNLICEMEYDGASPIPDDWSPPKGATLPNLTNLLWSTEMTLPLEKFLPCCPKLRALTVASDEFGDTRILQRLDALCPTLQYFSTTDTETINANLDQIIHVPYTYITSHDKKDIGLRALYFDSVYGLKDDDIIPLFQRHHDHLHYLSIRSDTIFNRYWSVIASLGARQLTTLDLRHRGPIDPLCRMILNSPLLQDVTLYFPISSQVMDTLSQLKHLKRLNIHEGPSDATEGAIRFAKSFCSSCSSADTTSDNNNHTNRSSSSSSNSSGSSSNNVTQAASNLLSINFSHSRFVTDHVLLLLAKIQTLRTVIVGDCPLLTTSGILQFIAQASHIETLGIYGLDSVTDQVMQAIGNHMERLEQLDISRCRSVTDYGVELLFSNINKDHTKLKKLAVQGCPSIGEHSTTMIERKLGLTTPLFTSLY